MGFQQGLSGLNAASKQLEVVGNNVANAGTVGFKSGETQFADVYAASLGGSGGEAGIGVKVAAITQSFSQGSVTASSNPLDVAINGGGMFRLVSGGEPVYTRNGQFHRDKDGFIANADGALLTGYPVDAQGNLVTGTPVPLNISTAGAKPHATTNMAASINLDARAPVLSAAAFDPTDSDSFTDASSVNVFDTLGNPHTLQTYYVKTGASSWSVFGASDGVPLGYAPPAAPVALGTLSFKNDGSIDTAASTLPMTASVAVGGGAASPLSVQLDFSKTTQYGSPFAIDALSQDGYAPGTLAGFAIGADGVITGRYTNGTTSTLGQVVLASFKNENGLVPRGGNTWAASASAGTPVVGAPSSGTLGALSQGVEESNVDLTAELVDMIVAQRSYQANAQTIKTVDQMLQTMMSLR
jgi:flagellar hook protein FlgE